MSSGSTSSGDTTDGRPAKRLRSEAAFQPDDHSDVQAGPDVNAGPTETFTRDEEFWYPDGTLILDLQGTAFRIYMCLISEQSRVLGDLFKSSPHLCPDGSCDRAPVVCLTDSPHDWRYLLRILLPKKTVLPKMTFNLQNDFSMLSALVRLSHKYEIMAVKEYAITGLKNIYTDDYDTWIGIDRSVCGAWSSPGERKVTRPSKTYAARSRLLSQAIVVINFSRLLNVPSILPTAFYHCACLGGAVIKGYTYEDGTIEYLSDDDVVRCINGMQALTAATADYVPLLRGHLPDHHTCTKGGACRRLWKDSVSDQLAKGWQLAFGNLALRGVVETFPTLDALCGPCKGRAESQIEEKRRQVWKVLPRIFNIEGTVTTWPASTS